LKVFLTGNLGYVGNVLSELLTKQNIEIVGCDVNYFPQNFVPNNSKIITQLYKDIRSISKEDLLGCDVVFHLAALSNDPMGEINSELTHDINFQATTRLAELSRESGVKRFVFSSSCSTYGANSDVVNENSSLLPLTAYAKSKVSSESEILKLKTETFAPIILRSATAYGISSSLRLDLVVNNLTCSAYTTGNVRLLSDGTSWRPLLHVEDMSNAFIQMMKAPIANVSGEIFNVGNNDHNYTVQEIAKKVEEIVPNSTITYAENADKDSRSYKVNFDKIKEHTNFRTNWDLEKGIKQLYDTFQKNIMTKENFLSDDFYRVKFINSLINTQKIDKSLKFTS
jgi:nucleoside-diphosphate-sugar epimerase